MQHIFWVIENELAGRPGPNEEAWCPEELYVGGFRAVLTLNSGAGVNAAALRKAGLAHHRIALPVKAPPQPGAIGICKEALPEAYELLGHP